MPSLSAAEARLCQVISTRFSAMLTDLRQFVDLRTGPGPGQAEQLDAFRSALLARLAAVGGTSHLIAGNPSPAWLKKPGDAGPTTPPPTAIVRNFNPAAPGSAAGRAVLLAGHLDTVHPTTGDFSGLSIATDHSTATGPGTVDMKGGIVLALHALEALAECGIPVHWSFLLNSDEETGSFASDQAIRSEASLVHNQSRIFTAGLAFEPAVGGAARADAPRPATWKLALARGGSGQFHLVTTGRRAHVGRDFAAGVSAVDALCRTIIAAHAASDPARGICVNISPLWCPDATNVVAGEAAAWGNVRYPDPQAGQHLQAALAALATDPAAMPAITVNSTFSRPAKPADDATRALAARYQQCCRDLGGELEFMTSAGVCDGNNMQAAGLPTIDTLGICGGGLHTTTEWVELSSMVHRCQCLALLIARLASGC